MMPAPQPQPPPPPAGSLPRLSRSVSTSGAMMAPPPAVRPQVSLQKPSSQNKSSSKSRRLMRRFRSAFRSFPIINPTCKMPIHLLHGNRLHSHDSASTLTANNSGVGNLIQGRGTRMTGTLFGYRKSRVNLVIQENPRCLPMLVLQLSIPTGKLLQDMGLGLVRIALECEKSDHKTKLVDEPIWTMYCNGKKTGYAVKREATDDEDMNVMQMLHAVSMGAGVLPISSANHNTGNAAATAISNESSPEHITYMRAFFERVIGSKDSETYYMMNPDGNSGPELSIFFVRIG